jgi:hypothetical protein
MSAIRSRVNTALTEKIDKTIRLSLVGAHGISRMTGPVKLGLGELKPPQRIQMFTKHLTKRSVTGRARACTFVLVNASRRSIG